MLSNKERKMLIELIANEQLHMLIKHPERYESDKYVRLEDLKVKIKNIGGTGYEK